MKKSIVRILAGALVTAVCADALNAEDLATEITVDRTVVPVEQAAGAPRSFRPELLRPATAAYRMPLTDYARTSACSDSLPVLPPAAHPGLAFASGHRGYASLGYFPALNFGAAAGYRIIDRTATNLDVWGSYQGRSYSSRRIPAATPDKAGRISDHSLQLAAAASQNVGGRSLLSAGFTYRHDALRLPTPLDPEAGQAVNAFRGNIGWTTRWRNASIAAAVSAGRTALHSPLAVPGVLSPDGIADGAAEARYTMDLTAEIHGRHSVGGALVLGADILNRQRGLMWADGFTAATRPGKATGSIFGISPRALFHGRHLRGHLGLRIDIAGGYGGHALHVAPDINLGWTPSATFGIFLRADGGSRHNSLDALAAINPFANGATVASRSTTAVDARAGVTIGPFAGFSAEIYGGYASTHGALMPVLLHTREGDFATFGPADLSGWNMGGRLSYVWRTLLEISADARLLPHGRTARGMAAVVDRARYTVDAHLTLRPIRPLAIDLGYSLRGGRRFYAIAPGGIPEASDAGRLSRLDLGATYILTSAWSIFLRVENMLDSRPLLLPGLPAQGVAGLAGATLKF